MQVRELTGELREANGKKGTRAVRREGKVPCVIYGGEAPVSFKLDELAVEKSLNTPQVFIYKLNIGGKEVKAVMKEVQFHPITDAPLHVDFLEVTDAEPVKIAIPVKLDGVPEGVLAGGKLQVKNRKLRVQGLIADLPDTLDIDISKVALGQSVKIDSLSFDKLEILEAKNAVVCAVKLTRSAIRDAALANQEAEAEEAAE